MPNFHIISIFPEFFQSPLNASLLGRARQQGILQVSLHDPRQFSASRHRHVDDSPYGGGAGMVMQAGPIAAAIKSIPRPGKIINLSPAGEPLTARLAEDLAREADLTLICGRYEGIDARLGEIFPLREISVGEAVLNGGETAALAVIESVSRFLPGFMGKTESAREESFANGLLEYPHYTRPENICGLPAPAILLSGHDARIRAWRRQQALTRTLAARPDLLARAPLSKTDAETLAALPRLCLGRNLSFCLVHYPVLLENGRVGASSLTNLDIHDIARIARSYGMAALYILTPVREQLNMLGRILEHWRCAATGGKGEDRSRALALARPAVDFGDVDAQATRLHGVRPVYLASSAQWPKRKNAPSPLAPADALALLEKRPVVICLGTARGLAPQFVEQCDGLLRPLRFLNDNHLSVRSAAAILADRILGDFR